VRPANRPNESAAGPSPAWPRPGMRAWAGVGPLLPEVSYSTTGAGRVRRRVAAGGAHEQPPERHQSEEGRGFENRDDGRQGSTWAAERSTGAQRRRAGQPAAEQEQIGASQADISVGRLDRQHEAGASKRTPDSRTVLWAPATPATTRTQVPEPVRAGLPARSSATTGPRPWPDRSHRQTDHHRTRVEAAGKRATVRSESFTNRVTAPLNDWLVKYRPHD